eukprot:scaffold254914_cov41-Tisochrysis_lutea.AAC.2
MSIGPLSSEQDDRASRATASAMVLYCYGSLREVPLSMRLAVEHVYDRARDGDEVSTSPHQQR